MTPREPRHERDAYIAARERAQELSRFARWAMTQDATPARSRMPGRRQPINFGQWLVLVWRGWDPDMRVGMAGIACLFALGVIVKTWG
jgi:hypothetical protein